MKEVRIARSRLLLCAAGLALGVGWTAAPALAAETLPSPSRSSASPALVAQLFFHIMRNDRHIGNALIKAFAVDGDIKVNIRTHVLIRIGPQIDYNFRQEVDEVWRNGQLVSYRADTDDNFVTNLVALKLAPQGPILSRNGVDYRVSPDIAPTSLWSESMLKRSQYFDPLEGLLQNVVISPAKVVELELDGQMVKTRHFTIDGDIERKLWYGENGALLRLALTAPDGSEVVYVLQ